MNKKLIFLLAILALFLIGCGQQADVAESGITRELPETANMGEDITVKIHVNLNPEQTYYLFDEGVPTEFEILEAEHDSNNHIKVVEIQEAKSYVYEYTLKAPETAGTYTFSGEYAVEGMKDPTEIIGDTQIIVQ